jgi:hypothetical protein
MSKLSFVARGARLARVPNAMQFIGQPANYINRKLAQLKNGRFAYPATETPYTVDSAIEPKVAERCKTFVAREALWPFDSTTAKACGVPFVPLEFNDGEWAPKKPSKK